MNYIINNISNRHIFVRWKFEGFNSSLMIVERHPSPFIDVTMNMTKNQFAKLFTLDVLMA